MKPLRNETLLLQGNKTLFLKGNKTLFLKGNKTLLPKDRPNGVFGRRINLTNPSNQRIGAYCSSRIDTSAHILEEKAFIDTDHATS